MILTIGHSNHPIDMFLSLLHGARVTALADVRSAPWSKRWPQYRREALKDALESAGIAYVWLGEALGGKPKDRSLWTDGRPDRQKIAASPAFAAGIDRLVAGSTRYQVAIMCAEKDPMHCHRTHLVTPALIDRGIDIRHLLADGTVLPETDRIPPPAPDLFSNGP